MFHQPTNSLPPLLLANNKMENSVIEEEKPGTKSVVNQIETPLTMYYNLKEYSNYKFI